MAQVMKQSTCSLETNICQLLFENAYNYVYKSALICWIMHTNYDNRCSKAGGSGIQKLILNENIWSNYATIAYLIHDIYKQKENYNYLTTV